MESLTLITDTFLLVIYPDDVFAMEARVDLVPMLPTLSKLKVDSPYAKNYAFTFVALPQHNELIYEYYLSSSNCNNCGY